ncbi:unnamed protein product [Clonostachys rhizophaga]|uniref:mitogen-activated protein kinase n=1 Tax=Clonostachys rhizophaga TaxID=160324 RepID=A0A9N9VAQ8_9HYPO|nr:unnamed protein product [Clonostachys rhizophaga]
MTGQRKTSGRRTTSGRRKTDGMPEVGERANVLFHLEPVNRRTERLFKDAENSPLQAIDDYGTVVLEIGHVMSVWGSKTLACIGRHRLDVCLYDPSISVFQCFFEINRNTGVIMFNDISARSTSRFIGSNATDFPPNLPRRVVILPRVNTQIQLGHEGVIQFNIVWNDRHPQGAIAAAQALPLPHGITDNQEIGVRGGGITPRLTRPESKSPSIWNANIKWTKIDDLGAGGFGMVSKGINLFTGEFMAVKQLKQRPRIVEFYGSSGHDTGSIKMFMGLRDGSLASFLKKYPGTSRIDLAQRVLRQMLEALACVASHNMIHHDVKPDNILYSMGSCLESTEFFLCDFGQAYKGGVDKECGGTRLFRPPEIFQRRPNTPKVDIWALFVTMLEILDEKDWRRRSRKCDASANSQFHPIELVEEFADDEETEAYTFRKMARIDPDKRYSAEGQTNLESS